MGGELKVIQGGREEKRCGQCSLRPICLPESLPDSYVHEISKIIKTQPPVAKNGSLYRQGEAFTMVYALRAGTVKNVSVSEDGIEYVNGFHFPGDLIGLESLGRSSYTSSAIALERISVCGVPIKQLEALCSEDSRMMRRIFDEFGKEFSGGEVARKRLLRHDAEERLADFLVETAKRLENTGRSAIDLYLSMSRRDIGRYIGLAPETVSRSFTRLEDSGLLRVEGKRVQILDQRRLQLLVETTSGLRTLNE